MPVSALVITLSAEAAQRTRALAALRDHPRLLLGSVLNGTRVPAVLETDTLGEGIRVVEEELPAIEGVLFVDVVQVDFSDVDPAAEALPLPRRRRREDAA